MTEGLINDTKKLENNLRFNGKSLVDVEPGAMGSDLHFRKVNLATGWMINRRGPRLEAGGQLGACGYLAG